MMSIDPKLVELLKTFNKEKCDSKGAYTKGPGPTSDRLAFPDNSKNEPSRMDYSLFNQEMLQSHAGASHVTNTDRQMQQSHRSGNNAMDIERQIYDDASAKMQFNSGTTIPKPHPPQDVSAKELAALTKKLTVLAKDPAFLEKLQNMSKERGSSQIKKGDPMSSSVIVGSGRKFSADGELTPIQGRQLSNTETFQSTEYDVKKAADQELLIRDKYLFPMGGRNTSSIEHPEAFSMFSSMGTQESRTKLNTDIWDNLAEKDWSQEEDTSLKKIRDENPNKMGQGNQDLLLSTKRGSNVDGFFQSKEKNFDLEQKFSNLFHETSLESPRKEVVESSAPGGSTRGDFSEALKTMLDFEHGSDHKEKETPVEKYALRSNETDDYTPRSSGLEFKIGNFMAELRQSREHQLKLGGKLKEREEEAWKLTEFLLIQNDRINQLEKVVQQAQALSMKNSQALEQSEGAVKKLQDIVTQQHDKINRYDDAFERFQKGQLKCATRLSEAEDRLKALETDNQCVRDCMLESQEVVKKMVTKFDMNMFRLEGKVVAGVEKNLQQGGFSWTPAFGESLMRCIEEKKMPPYIESPHFQIPESNGYTIVFEAYPCGYGRGRKTHLSVFWRLLPSENDNKLKWPFKGKVTFTLLPVIAEGKPIVYTTRILAHRKPFKKPILNNETDVCDGWGSSRFVTKERALSQYYLTNNQLEFNVKVELE